MKKCHTLAGIRLNFKQETGFINQEFSEQGTLWLDIWQGLVENNVPDIWVCYLPNTRNNRVCLFKRFCSLFEDSSLIFSSKYDAAQRLVTKRSKNRE